LKWLGSFAGALEWEFRHSNKELLQSNDCGFLRDR